MMTKDDYVNDDVLDRLDHMIALLTAIDWKLWELYKTANPPTEEADAVPPAAAMKAKRKTAK